MREIQITSDAGYWIPDTGYRILDSGCWMQVVCGLLFVVCGFSNLNPKLA